MKITIKQLRRIIREAMTFDQRDSDRWDDSGSSGWDDISSYDMGYDDWINGMESPMRPKDSEYMAGWEAATEESHTTERLMQQHHQTNEQKKIDEAMDPRFHPQAFDPWKEPRAGKLDSTQALYDKIRKDDPDFAAEWMHDKEDMGLVAIYENEGKIQTRCC